MNLRRVAAFALLLLLATALSHATLAQQDPPPAPFPPAIRAAKTVFISKASGASYSPAITDDLAYNKFYAAMKGWDRYQLVSSPSDADLVVEIRFDCLYMPCGFNLRANILEPKTHTILWAIDEPVVGASRQSFDKSMAALVEDVKTLAGSANHSSVP
jgi:hypothetical protein